MDTRLREMREMHQATLRQSTPLVNGSQAQGVLPRVENAELALLQEKTGYTFKNQDLALAALDLTELSNDHAERTLTKGVGTSCQNLAIVGDLVLELALADKWFEIASIPTTWTALKDRIAPNAALERFCMDSGLIQCQGGRQSTTTWQRATLVEAVLGAVYLDSGKSLAAVQTTMEWLGILQVAMKTLQEAELSREARIAKKGRKRRRGSSPTPKRSRARRWQARERENENENGNASESKGTRVYIEISDDSDDEDNAV